MMSKKIKNLRMYNLRTTLVYEILKYFKVKGHTNNDFQNLVSSSLETIRFKAEQIINFEAVSSNKASNNTVGDDWSVETATIEAKHTSTVTGYFTITHCFLTLLRKGRLPVELCFVINSLREINILHRFL